MPTVFKNPMRPVGKTVEGHGEYATTWVDYECLCPLCNRWFRGYGEVSIHEPGKPEVQEWICTDCASDDFR